MKISWAAGLMALALPVVAEAHDGFGFSVHVPLPSISIHGPGFYCGPRYCGPRYYERGYCEPPVVYAPPPVTYYAPAPVYAVPPPVVYEAPAVVYGPPVVYGPSVSVYAGPRYYRPYGHYGYRR
jgi:hypothetical protein